MFFSIRTFNPHYFEYKKQVYRYSSFGLSVQKDYADYRKITEYDVQYLKENGFNYFLADYHSGGFDEKPKNWKDFGAIEDEKGYVYIPFIDIDDAIRRKREYYKSQGYGAYDSIVFVKFISLSDIEAFYKISSYIQIDGQNFPFSKPTEDIGYYQYYHMCPTYEYYKDKFIGKEVIKEISDDELKKRLLDFRVARSKELNYPAYYVFNNDELDKLVELRPKTLEELKNSNILAPIKVKTHGELIIQIINERS